MPGKRAFDEQLAALDRLKQLAPEECIAPLRKALQHRNNFVVSKAADLVRTHRLTQLIPELLTAFDRAFEDPTKNDPQCWAKNAISRALADLEHQEAATYLRGLHFIQHEPGWGGASDSAATLRATCALALVQCRSLTDAELLKHFVDLLADKEKIVRVEAVNAIAQVGNPACSLLLRLRALAGDDEPEVLGACYSGILRLEGASAIPWVARFLESSSAEFSPARLLARDSSAAKTDDAAAEAALAIAGTHTQQAFEVLRRRLPHTGDPWLTSVLLSAIALTRQDAAVEFLLDHVRKETPQAEAAIEAILRSLPSPEVTQRLEDLVATNRRLARVFATHRPGAR
jgi:HEAT repeat protein